MSPELWLYMRRHPALQLMVKVFDPTRHWGKPHNLDHDSEHGRGLAVIEGLSAEHGFHLSRSRLGRWPIPGKVAWAAMPLPPTWPYPPESAPPASQALHDLHTLLAGRGITRLQHAHSEEVSLLVVRTGLTVWARDTFYWQDHDGRYTHRTFGDVQDVAEKLVQQHEEYDDHDRHTHH